MQGLGWGKTLARLEQLQIPAVWSGRVGTAGTAAQVMLRQTGSLSSNPKSHSWVWFPWAFLGDIWRVTDSEILGVGSASVTAELQGLCCPFPEPLLSQPCLGHWLATRAVTRGDPKGQMGFAFPQHSPKSR